MKKSLSLSILIFCFSFLIFTPFAQAQYTKLHDFAVSTGCQPDGSLYSDGTFLYGMTKYGGLNSRGAIFKIKPDGTGYLKIFDFSYPDGSFPSGSLISDGTYLYGITYQGGASDQGVIFKIKKDGSGYAKVMDLSWPTGCYSYSTLFYDGTFLYGTAYAGGGGSLQGNIFKVKPDGTGFLKLHDFAGSDGANPNAALISDGTYLYGTTVDGGSTNEGTVFRIKPDGTGFLTLHDFNVQVNGRYPHSSLISVGAYLYGTTSEGGPTYNGTIFKVKPDGTGFSKVWDFSGINGSNPNGDLISDGTFLYGMTPKGGTSDSGVLFKIMPSGTQYAKLMDFTGLANGSYPNGSLISDGTYLYGMTSAGGSNYKGVIFKHKYISITAGMVGNPICSNQCNGVATATVVGGTPPYTYSWSSIPVQTTSTATGLCPGTYTVNGNDNTGSTSTVVTILALPQPTTPQICLVTVDSLSKNNIIIWDKAVYPESDSMIVYRDTANNNWAKIGAVSKDSLSWFIDTVRTLYSANGDPKASSWRYKIAVLDTCGVLGQKSPYHQSIFIQNVVGNFSWNQYQIEGQPIPVPGLSNYLFLRDNLSTGIFVTVQTLSASSTAYTDPLYSTYQSTGSWRVKTNWTTSCTPSIKNPEWMSTIKTTKSNTFKTVNPTGVNESAMENRVNVYPNPSSGKFTVAVAGGGNGKLFLKVYNTVGQLMYAESFTGNKKEISVDLAKGIYQLQIESGFGCLNKKVIIR